MHIPIMLLYATTMYNQIISQIGHSSTTLQDISNNFLVLLIRCDCYAKHQVLISIKSTTCNKCGDLARFLLKFHLMEAPLELEFREHVQPFRSYRTCSIVGIGCLSLAIAAFALRMSTQILISPSAFGPTASGDTHSVGLSDTSSEISLACNSSNFSPTFSIQREAFSQVV